MSFLKVFLRGTALLPSVVQGVETLYGAKAGKRKRQAAVAILYSSLCAAEGSAIADQSRFVEALGVIVDGVVGCLNASVWSKRGEGGEHGGPPYNRAMSVGNVGEQRGRPLVGVVMGSRSDFAVMKVAVAVLREFDVRFEAKVVSAHRTPELMVEYGRSAAGRGLRCIIAGAGGAAHLPGMLAALTVVPVLGVPVAATALQGLDALLSIVQMPKGVPVGTLAIGASGAANAALLAVAMLATTDPELQERLIARREAVRDEVLAETLEDDGTGDGVTA